MSMIGIDLGTTNSCVAVWQNDKVEIIANNQGSRTTPSCVGFSPTERFIGKPAVLQMIRNPTNTVHDVKRLIGREFNDPIVQGDMKRRSFKVVDVGNAPRIQVEYMNETKTFAPEEISAMLLGDMKSIAERFIGEEVTGAVVTVPASFTSTQRAATMNAGKIAGFKLVRIINEPTAAALAYGHSTRSADKRNILVYDLGGGTFDVTIVAVKKGTEFNVLASTGNTDLGGGDFDDLLSKHLASKFLDQTGMNVLDNKKSLCKLNLKSNEAKEMLTSNVCYDVYIDCLMDGEDLSEKVYRTPFEDLCGDLFRSTLVHVRKALYDAKLTKADIDEVVLVGGSTRIPMIQQLLQEFLPGKSLKANINPDEAVAYGAAIQAAILSGDSSIKFTNLISDITALSLGIADASTGVMSVIIPRNTVIPTMISKYFKTVRDNQSSFCIQILEGDRSLVKDNHKLGLLTLDGIHPAPAGKNKALVTFELDVNGILRVTAMEKATGRKSSMAIQMKQKGLSVEEVHRMIKDAEKYREYDKNETQIAMGKDELLRLVKNRSKLHD